MAGVSGIPLVAYLQANGKYGFYEASGISVKALTVNDVPITGAGGGGTANVKTINVDVTATTTPFTFQHNLNGKVVIQATDATGNHVDVGYQIVDKDSVAICYNQTQMAVLTSTLTITAVGGQSLSAASIPESATEDSKRYALLVS